MTAVVLLVLGGAAGSATAAMSVIYDLDPAAREIVLPSSGASGLDGSRGAFRQEGSNGHLFAGATDAPYRLGKVSGAALATMSVEGIAATLRAQVDACVIDGRDYGCASHLAFVDEITVAYSDGPVPVHPRGRTRYPLPPPPPDSPGARLTAAMRLLAATDSPYGGSYASRVHFYVTPAMIRGMARGLGPHHNLARNGKPHFRTWRAVLPGLARGGGVWLEMFHASGNRVTGHFGADLWRDGPRDFLGLFGRVGGSVDAVHFLIAGAARKPGGATGCASPMACVWALAGTGPNAAILRNGAGAYRVGDQAAEWLQEHYISLH